MELKVEWIKPSIIREVGKADFNFRQLQKLLEDNKAFYNHKTYFSDLIKKNFSSAQIEAKNAINEKIKKNNNIIDFKSTREHRKALVELYKYNKDIKGGFIGSHEGEGSDIFMMTFASAVSLGDYNTVIDLINGIKCGDIYIGCFNSISEYVDNNFQRTIHTVPESRYNVTTDFINEIRDCDFMGTNHYQGRRSIADMLKEQLKQLSNENSIDSIKLAQVQGLLKGNISEEDHLGNLCNKINLNACIGIANNVELDGEIYHLG